MIVKMKKIIIQIVLMLCLFSVYALDTESTGTASENKINAADFSGTAQRAMSSSDYMVTAGDVYSLTYAAGTAAVSYTIPVDPSYKIRVSNLAVIDAAGKSYMTLKKQVEEIVQKNYPMSGVQFVLLNPSSFKVTVCGEVSKTSEIGVWGLTRLSSVVYAFATPYSSFRTVTVVSDSGKSKKYDLFLADRDGDLSQNPYLRPDDTIIIGHINRSVSINGSVERPGTYELLDGENLKELVFRYANGLSNLADTSRITLTRYISDNYPSGENIYLSQRDIDSDYKLQHYDSVNISSYTALRPVVFVEGALGGGDDTTPMSNTRVSIQFDNNMNYAYFVRAYSSLFSSSSADLQHAYIIRKGEAIPVDFTEMLYDYTCYSDLNVEPNDIVRVPFKQNFISVAGAVYSPGRYPYIPDRDASYYIGLAGGFIKEKNVKNSIEIVDMAGRPLSEDDVITPECTITAKTNSFTYFFNQYAPVITTILSITGSTLSILAATHVIK